MMSPMPLPYPLNLTGDWKFAAFREMTPVERIAISCDLSTEYRRRWLRALREWYPRATAA